MREPELGTFVRSAERVVLEFRRCSTRGTVAEYSVYPDADSYLLFGSVRSIRAVRSPYLVDVGRRGARHLNEIQSERILIAT